MGTNVVTGMHKADHLSEHVVLNRSPNILLDPDPSRRADLRAAMRLTVAVPSVAALRGMSPHAVCDAHACSMFSSGLGSRAAFFRAHHLAKRLPGCV